MDAVPGINGQQGQPLFCFLLKIIFKRKIFGQQSGLKLCPLGYQAGQIRIINIGLKKVLYPLFEYGFTLIPYCLRAPGF